MKMLTQYCGFGGGENALFNNVSRAQVPIFVVGCSSTSFTAPSLSNFIKIQKLSKLLPALALHRFMAGICFAMNSFPSC